MELLCSLCRGRSGGERLRSALVVAGRITLWFSTEYATSTQICLRGTKLCEDPPSLQPESRFGISDFVEESRCSVGAAFLGLAGGSGTLVVRYGHRNCRCCSHLQKYAFIFTLLYPLYFQRGSGDVVQVLWVLGPVRVLSQCARAVILF